MNRQPKTHKEHGSVRRLKRAAGLIVLLLAGASAFSQNLSENLSGIERWITDFPKGRTEVAGYKIIACAIERTGALVVIDRAGVPLRLNIIQPIGLAALTAKIRHAEKTVLAEAALNTENARLALKEAEFDFGLKDEMAITLRFTSFRVRVSQESVLELAGRLEADPVFYHQPKDNAFLYTLRFRAIDPGTGRRDLFPGWPEYVRRLIEWFRKGIEAENQAVLALVLETRVMSREERQAEGRIVLAKDTKSNLWIGMNVDYLMSNCLAGETGGVYWNPAGYNLIQPMLYLSWRNLGDPEWLAKPYQFTIALGGFFEFNARYAADPAAMEYSGFPAGNGSFLIAGGPSLGIEFTAMIPKISDNRYTGDLFGIGIELLGVVNVPYFFPDYYYEYFWNQYFNIIVHLLPVDGIGADLIIGFNMAFGTQGFEDAGAVTVSKYGFTAGARLKIDFDNFFKYTELFK